jgi:hypothetical protein
MNENKQNSHNFWLKIIVSTGYHRRIQLRILCVTLQKFRRQCSFCRRASGPAPDVSSMTTSNTFQHSGFYKHTRISPIVNGWCWWLVSQFADSGSSAAHVGFLSDVTGGARAVTECLAVELRLRWRIGGGLTDGMVAGPGSGYWRSSRSLSLSKMDCWHVTNCLVWKIDAIRCPGRATESGWGGKLNGTMWIGGDVIIYPRDQNARWTGSSCYLSTVWRLLRGNWWLISSLHDFRCGSACEPPAKQS